MTERIVERLADIKRSFETTLVLGCHTGQVAARLPKTQIGDVIQSDLSPSMVEQVRGPRLAADEERLPFGFDCFDLVIAIGNLHWVNDLPGTLIQLRYALKPDGLLLAALPGGRTLHELRSSLDQAEVQVNEVAAPPPRVAPFIDVPDAGDLLRRTGFALPVADIDTLTVTYAHPLKLLADLRGMGESNVLLESSKKPLGRGTLMAACQAYQETYGDAQGRIPATFQLLMLAAWSPGPGQPKPRAWRRCWRSRSDRPSSWPVYRVFLAELRCRETSFDEPGEGVGAWFRPSEPSPTRLLRRFRVLRRLVKRRDDRQFGYRPLPREEPSARKPCIDLGKRGGIDGNAIACGAAPCGFAAIAGDTRTGLFAQVGDQRGQPLGEQAA